MTLSDIQEVPWVFREIQSHQEELLVKVMLQSFDSGQSDALNVRQPTIKQGNITAIEQDDNGFDSLSRVQKTWVGRFYQSTLKQYPVIRKLALWLWAALYPKYVHLVAILSGNTITRPIVKLTDYVDAHNVPKREVLGASKVDTPAPLVIPKKNQIHLVSPHNHYESPPIYVAQLSDAQVSGGTNLVFMQEAVICHDLYDFAREYTSEERHGRHIINAKKKRIRIVKNDTTPEYMPVAAAFLDACARNYAHWLSEVLPRIAVFCSVEQHAHVAIIIDDGLHSNIMESLWMVVGPDREVVTLPIGRSIRVDTLYTTSVTGYVPFERKKTTLTGHSHGIFNSLAFDLLRKRLLSFIDEHPFTDLPRKIYLRRTSGGRKVANAGEIEQCIVSNGYVIVEPENLTFLQQLVLFSSVDDIVGPSGAALANLLFSRSDVRVHILIGQYAGTSYWYWQNMACASGKRVIYSLGELKDSQSTIHSDFVIDPKVFSYEN